MISLLLAAEVAKLGAAVGAGLAAIGAGIGIGRRRSCSHWRRYRYW